MIKRILYFSFLSTRRFIMRWVQAYLFSNRIFGHASNPNVWVETHTRVWFNTSWVTVSAMIVNILIFCYFLTYMGVAVMKLPYYENKGKSYCFPCEIIIKDDFSLYAFFILFKKRNLYILIKFLAFDVFHFV